jgi:ferritin-like metal-binding protein YciE
MTLNSMDDLFHNELKDVYNAEKQLVAALPRMAKAAQSPKLQQAITKHLRETEGHVKRLEQILQSLGEPLRGKRCKGMEGLIEEGKEILEEEGAAEVIDAAIISAAQRVEHYEIAAYGCLRTYA